MYAVIFKARFINVDQLSAEYFTLAKQLQLLEKEQYGCQEFTSMTEGDDELAISYWLSLEDIQRWNNDPVHKVAQAKGSSSWYESYSVEVVEVLKKYNNRS